MKQQQPAKVKSEPKSWNKVVSDGQKNVVTNVPIKNSVAVKKSMQAPDVGSAVVNNAQKQQPTTLAGIKIIFFLNDVCSL